ncbi:hypothetical protein [Agaribacter marinus]|uniref:Uncharacterized protein n=1 Tax=Agaribacter marinus TaxID=1431249 RepID=A0AA37T0F5_9ALTE|nr:hypothetical protein [Agaribacter marinus]GLR70088.1 hypothetical protein GCM10007852_09960 [Agaribacter marinus]
MSVLDKILSLIKMIKIFVNNAIKSFNYISKRNYKRVADTIAPKLRGKTGLKDKIYRMITPMSHYFADRKIIINAVLINSERFLAIIALLIAIVGTVYGLTKEEGKGGLDFLKGFAIYFYIIILLAPFISFSLTRVNAKEFAQVIHSGKVTDEDFIKNTAYEAYRVVEYVYRYIDQDSALVSATQRMKDSFAICDETKVVLAERLKVTPREVADDFLKFSGSIFINRCTKLEDLQNLISLRKNLENTNANRDANAIKLYFDSIKAHLWQLMHTQINLNNFVSIFQTRSISGATRQLIKFIEKESKNNNIRSAADLKLIIDLQKAHRTGSSAHKAIGLALSKYIDLGESANESDETLLLNRVKCLSDSYLSDNYKLLTEQQVQDMLKSFDGWHDEADGVVSEQRKSIGLNFGEYFELIYSKHNEEQRKGNVYIVMSSYSRAVKAIIRHVLSKYETQDFKFVICDEDVNYGNYSARLMYQQILEEYISVGDVNKDNHLYLNSWRSTFTELEGRLVSGQDTVVYLAGCDQFDLIHTSTGSVETAAYKYSSMSLLNELVKNEKKINLNAIVLAGEYKLDHAILCEKLPEQLKDDVLSILPKCRRSYLHQWLKDMNSPFEFKLISSNRDVDEE